MFRLTPVAAAVQAICRNWSLFTGGQANPNDWRNLNYEVAVRSGRRIGDKMADEILEQIQDCENHSDQLTGWEASFIQSLSEWYSKKNTLTPKQEATLDRIWEKVTSSGGSVAKRGK